MQDSEFIKLPWNHPCADHWNSGRMSEVLQLMKAGDNGRQAYKADRTRRDNPYPAHTALHEQWDTSFCQALHFGQTMNRQSTTLSFYVSEY